MTKRTLERRFWKISDELREKGEFEEAIIEYKELVVDAEKEGFYDPHQQIAVTYGLLEKYDQAEKWFKKTLNLARKAKDYRTYGNTLRDFATLFTRLKKYDEAVGYFEKSIESLCKTTDFKGIIASIDKLGVCFSYLRDYKKAKEHVISAITLVKYCKDRDSEYFYHLFLYDLAKVLFNEGNFQEALVYAKESFDGCSRLEHLHRAQKAQELITDINKAVDNNLPSVKLTRRKLLLKKPEDKIGS
jgi:tetratricopeptide (TPR) repeat protein